MHLAPLRGGRAYYLSAILAFGCTSNSNAAQNPQGPLSVNAAIVINEFDYREWDEQDQTLDEEDGRIPGIAVGMRWNTPRWFGTAELSFDQGNSDYVAYPNGHAPLVSKTRESVTKAALAAGATQTIHPSLRLEYFGTVGLTQWSRDIQPLPGIAGLDESYTWPFWGIGLMPVLRLDSDSQLSLRVTRKRSLSPGMSVTFTNNLYDTADIEQPNGWSWNVELAFEHRLNPHLSVRVAACLDSWRFGKSGEFPLTRNGLPAGSVHEPASEFQQLGIRFGLQRSF